MMKAVERFQQWLKDNPPADMPFWPGARITGRMGLRTSEALLEMGAAPLHLGVDRAGGDALTAPFDARIEWHRCGGVAGSVLRIIPTELPGMEVQVFHTAPERESIDRIEHGVERGQRMPVQPGTLGLSTGVHTHTEVLFQHDQDLFKYLRSIEGGSPVVRSGKPSTHYVHRHCQRYGLDERVVLTRLRQQVRTWAIADAFRWMVVRDGLPGYRQPGWTEPTMVCDSLWLLQI